MITAAVNRPERNLEGDHGPLPQAILPAYVAKPLLERSAAREDKDLPFGERSAAGGARRTARRTGEVEGLGHNEIAMVVHAQKVKTVAVGAGHQVGGGDDRPVRHDPDPVAAAFRSHLQSHRPGISRDDAQAADLLGRGRPDFFGADLVSDLLQAGFQIPAQQNQQRLPVRRQEQGLESGRGRDAHLIAQDLDRGGARRVDLAQRLDICDRRLAQLEARRIALGQVSAGAAPQEDRRAVVREVSPLRVAPQTIGMLEVQAAAAQLVGQASLDLAQGSLCLIDLDGGRAPLQDAQGLSVFEASGRAGARRPFGEEDHRELALRTRLSPEGLQDR